VTSRAAKPASTVSGAVEDVTGLRYTLCETQRESLWSNQHRILYVMYVAAPNSQAL